MAGSLLFVPMLRGLTERDGRSHEDRPAGAGKRIEVVNDSIKSCMQEVHDTAIQQCQHFLLDAKFFWIYNNGRQTHAILTGHAVSRYRS